MSWTSQRLMALGQAGGLALAMALTAAQALALSGDEAEARLDHAIEQALHEGDSFVTADERATIERKCGYSAGSWDGFEASFSNGVFRCTNGRRVHDAEMRALMARGEPRIERRVETVMAHPEVRAAIERVASEASAEGLRELESGRDE